MLAFYRDGRDVGDDHEVQAAVFVGCNAMKFRFPNDEVLNGHRLWGRGPEFHSLHEVEDSAWLEDVRRVERTHERAPEVPFADTKHFILTFHDSTVEALAQQVMAIETHATMADAMASMTVL